MRSIKFRVWNKKLKKMFDVWSLDIVNEMASYHDKEDRYSTQGYNMPLEIMQFTGTKDKNGLEIYEGDLIKDNLGYGAVEYRENRAGFRLNYVDGLAKWFLDYTDDEFKTIEVTGNIYENAELLKV